MADDSSIEALNESAREHYARFIVPEMFRNPSLVRLLVDTVSQETALAISVLWEQEIKAFLKPRAAFDLRNPTRMLGDMADMMVQYELLLRLTIARIWELDGRPMPNLSIVDGEDERPLE